MNSAKAEKQDGFQYSNEHKFGNEPMHYHKHIEIIHAFNKTQLRVENENGIYDLTGGSYAVIIDSEMHRLENPYNGVLIESISFPVSFITLSGESFVRRSFIIPSEAFVSRGTAKALLNSLFYMLQERANINDTSSGLVKSLCSSVYTLLIDMYDNRLIRSSGSTQSTFVYEGKHKNISYETLEKFNNVVDYISSNYCNSDINLSVLSKYSGINKTFLSSLFPTITGSNFTQYLHRLRIERAMEYMYGFNKNISEIAFSCGFETIRSFNNVFKSVMGITPTEFIKTVKNNGNSGIHTEIDANDNKIFDFKWFTNHEESGSNSIRLIFNKNDNSLLISNENRYAKKWCHLMLRMLFFPGETYHICYKSKLLSNPVGTSSEKSTTHISFQFRDSKTNNIYHFPGKTDSTYIGDGWFEHKTHYIVPDYYAPSVIDAFSIYSEPVDDLGVSFIVKDINLKKNEVIELYNQ